MIEHQEAAAGLC